LHTTPVQTGGASGGTVTSIGTAPSTNIAPLDEVAAASTPLEPELLVDVLDVDVLDVDVLDAPLEVAPPELALLLAMPESAAPSV
jgi:hypothetical protein